jgi:hypothetical protein
MMIENSSFLSRLVACSKTLTRCSPSEVFVKTLEEVVHGQQLRRGLATSNNDYIQLPIPLLALRFTVKWSPPTGVSGRFRRSCIIHTALRVLVEDAWYRVGAQTPWTTIYASTPIPLPVLLITLHHAGTPLRRTLAATPTSASRTLCNGVSGTPPVVSLDCGAIQR